MVSWVRCGSWFIDSWSLPILLNCTKLYALSSILFMLLLKNIIIWQRYDFIQFIHISPIYIIGPLNLTYINYYRYLFWCQSFVDDSPYICSSYFKFCLCCWVATFWKIAAHSIGHLFSLYFGLFVFLNYYHFGFKSEIRFLIAPVSVYCFPSTYIIHSL